MYYGAIKKFDIANGPGCRTSLWVSGCSRACKGCFNADSQSFTFGKEFTAQTIWELDSYLRDPNCSGLSILGGDPLEPENLLTVEHLCELMKIMHPTKTIWLWTGYLWEDVKQLPVMKYIDVLIDGPFVESKKDLTLKWRGSSNQRVIDVKKSLETGEVILLED